MNSLFQVIKSIIKNATANEKGTGIGLLLVKEMVENHNGRIWLESSLGRGITFFVSLPYNYKYLKNVLDI